MTPCNIIIVDDNLKFRQGLRFYIENILNCRVVGEASNGYELERIDTINSDTIILMDIELPGLNGMELSKLLINRFKVAIIAITGYEDEHYIHEVKRIGLKGFVEKKNIYSNLGNAIEDIQNGQTFFRI